jgi:hypothetical protein
MKKILLAVALLAVTGSAMAQHHGQGLRHPGYYRGPGLGWWVAPVVVGAIGYELGRQQVIVQQPQVVIQNPPVMLGQSCTPWTETQHADGSVTRTRTCNQ